MMLMLLIVGLRLTKGFSKKITWINNAGNSD